MYSRKLVSILLVLLMVVTFGLQSVSASSESEKIVNPETGESINVRILKDNSRWRIVETWDNETKSLTTFDKQTNELVSETTDLKNGEVNVTKRQLSDISEKPTETSPITVQSTFTGQNLAGNYGYSWNSITNHWSLRIPGAYKTTYETSFNSSDLMNFRNAILDLRGAEIALHASVGAGGFALMASLITVPEPFSTVVGSLLAAGYVIGNITLVYNVWRYSKDCREYYARVF